MKQIIYASIPYYDIFFDQDGKFITMIHENDASVSKEYHSTLFEHFDINLEDCEVSEELIDKIYLGIDEGKDASDFIDDIKKEIFNYINNI